MKIKVDHENMRFNESRRSRSRSQGSGAGGQEKQKLGKPKIDKNRI